MKKVLKLLVAFAIVLLTVSMSSGETASAWEVRIGEQNFGYRGTFDGIGTRLGNAEERKCYPEFTVEFINTYLKPLYVGGYVDSYVTFRTSGVKNDCRGKIVALLPDVKTMESLSYDPLRCLENLMITDSTGKPLVLEVVQIGHEGTGYRYALLSHGTDMKSLMTDGMITTTEDSYPNTNSTFTDHYTINCYTLSVQIKGYFPGISVVQNGYEKINFQKEHYGHDTVSGKLFGETDIYPYGIDGRYCRSFSSKVNLTGVQNATHVKITCKRDAVPNVTLGAQKQSNRVFELKFSLVQDMTEKRTYIYERDVVTESLANWLWSGYGDLTYRKDWIPNYLFGYPARDALLNDFVFVREDSTARGVTTLIVCIGESNLYYLKTGYDNCKNAEERVNYLYNRMVGTLKDNKYLTPGKTYKIEFYTGAKFFYSHGNYVGYVKKTVQ